MLRPSIFGDAFMDDFFGFPESKYEKNTNSNGLMRTDIYENEEGFVLNMELPGCKKENVKAELKEGYLTITASRQDEQEAHEGKCIRKERYSGSCSRCYFVGKNLKKEDIKARFEDGVLKLFVPKVEKRPQVEESNYIMIDG